MIRDCWSTWTGPWKGAEKGGEACRAGLKHGDRRPATDSGKQRAQHQCRQHATCTHKLQCYILFT